MRKCQQNVITFADFDRSTDGGRETCPTFGGKDSTEHGQEPGRRPTRRRCEQDVQEMGQLLHAGNDFNLLKQLYQFCIT